MMHSQALVFILQFTNTWKNTRESSKERSNGFADSLNCGVKLSSCGKRKLLYADYYYAKKSLLEHKRNMNITLEHNLKNILYINVYIIL